MSIVYEMHAMSCLPVNTKAASDTSPCPRAIWLTPPLPLLVLALVCLSLALVLEGERSTAIAAAVVSRPS